MLARAEVCGVVRVERLATADVAAFGARSQVPCLATGFAHARTRFGERRRDMAARHCFLHGGSLPEVDGTYSIRQPTVTVKVFERVTCDHRLSATVSLTVYVPGAA
jgi:hypothetical protein